MRRRIAILASGTGSNAENLAAYFQNSDVAEVALLIAAGEAESGITIHYVSEGVDTGAAIAQFRCPVTPSDTPDTLAAKIHALEQAHLPEIIQKLVESIA